MSEQARLVEFLLVQDDPADELIAREDFAAYKVINRVLAVPDVPTALAYLDGTPPFGKARVLDVVLLDLNLPWPGGGAVLERLRRADATATIPVFLLVESPAAGGDRAFEGFAGAGVRAQAPRLHQSGRGGAGVAGRGFPGTQGLTQLSCNRHAGAGTLPHRAPNLAATLRVLGSWRS